MPKTAQPSARWASSPTSADPRDGTGFTTDSLTRFSRRVRETANILLVLASTSWLDRDLRDRARSIRADLLELGDTLERRAARERIEAEPAPKTDRLLGDIARFPDADASGPAGDSLLTAGPTNDATTDTLQGGGR